MSVALEDLNKRYQHLKFVLYDVNGAVDVVNWATSDVGWEKARVP